MSDPVTNVEIEDVLSSIRRLVSSEGRSVGPLVHSRPKEPEKLVLTPALRVDDGRPVPPEPSPAPAAGPAGPDTWNEDQERQPRGEAARHDDWQPDQPHEAAATDHETSGDRHDDAETPSGEMPDRSVELTARVAELEHIVARSTDQWEPDGQSSDAYSGGPVDPLPWEDYVPEAMNDPAPEDDGDADGDAQNQEPETPHAETGAHDAADVDDADWDADDIGSAEDPYEEADWDDDDDDIAAEAPPKAAAAATTDARRPAQARYDSALEGEDMLAEAEDVMDEDTLRDLVAEIVRQELQGALGERITRNVRKLVRREIHRALTAQELE